MAKLKTIEIEGATYAELNTSGAPVYLDDSGAEVGYDAPELAATVGQLTKDLRTTKSELTKAANKLTAFGDLDATAAKKALETVAALDSDKLVDAERINEVRTTTISEMEAKYQPIEAERDSLREQLYAEIVDGNFARSSYVRDQLVTPPQMVQATFGQHFKVEEGQLRAYGHDGNPLYSPSKPSEHASFEEAIKQLAESSPFADKIIKGRGQQGSNSAGGEGGGSSNVISRARFDQMSQAERAAAFKNGAVMQ